MEKEDIVQALGEMADLLEITDANPFEYRAIRSGAQTLDDWDGDLAKAVTDATLTEIPSIGKSIAAVISDLVTSDQSDELDRVRGLVPEELPRLLRFRGLGPKRVRALWKELGVESPDGLERVIQDGRVAELKGFGAKTVEKMLASIEYFRNNEWKPKQKPDLDSLPTAPVSSGLILAGTSGYSYPQWKGSFYPQKARTDDLLKHYAEKLATVEVNNTFYRFPSAKVVEQWKTLTPDNFQFALKAHRRVTHQMRLSPGTTIRIQEFVDRCSVLGSRLGCILFQLPPDFERDDQRLETLLSALPEGPRFAVEFRHKSWLDDSVQGKLADRNVACVAGDAENEPQQKLQTADFVYARLRKPAYSSVELDTWNTWFAKQQNAKRDVLAYLKHDETGAIPLEILKRWY